MSNIQIIEETIYSLEKPFAEVLVDDSISFAREAEFALQQISRSDFAMSTAINNRQSLKDAITNVAAIGISLNPARKQAYLVPRDKAICLDISYMGLLDMAVASGSIRWGAAKLVHQNDVFRETGLDKAPVHEREPFGDRGPVVGVYVTVKTHDGDYLTETMSLAEVYEIRDRSSAWKAWVAKGKKCPWVTDEGEMIKKTVIKRASKTWPRTDRLDKATHYLNTDGGEGLAETADARTQVDEGFETIIQEVRVATDLERIKELRRQGLTMASKSRNKAAYDAIEAAVVARRKELANDRATDVEYRDVQ